MRKDKFQELIDAIREDRKPNPLIIALAVQAS